MYAVYTKATPISEWEYEGLALTLEIALKACNLYNSKGYYTKMVEVNNDGTT